MDPFNINLSKVISYALRHRPDKFGLKLDGRGFVLTGDLINGINRYGNLNRQMSVEDIDIIIAESDKKRFEFADSKTRIRAVYGHSTKDVKIELNNVLPPDTLYHGTEHRVFGKILKDGLKPMNRQYVHLSDDIQTATIVGKRRDKNPVILIIAANRMVADGFKFGTGNDHTWLVESVPAEYISVL